MTTKGFFNAITPKCVWNQPFWIAGLAIGVIASGITIAVLALSHSLDTAVLIGAVVFVCITGITLIFSSYYGC